MNKQQINSESKTTVMAFAALVMRVESWLLSPSMQADLVSGTLSVTVKDDITITVELHQLDIWSVTVKDKNKTVFKYWMTSMDFGYVEFFEPGPWINELTANQHTARPHVITH